MKTLLRLALLAAAPALSLAQNAFPPHILGGELRVLEPSPDGRHYQLHVALPASYAAQPQRRYPVLFVTDAYWDFPTVYASYHNLVYDKAVPDFIIVGLGYAGEGLDYGELRRWELSPVELEPTGAPSGHADRFLAHLEDTIIPFVEANYRADPNHRALAGSSLGGLFTLYAMLTRPELFQGYIAASPATDPGDDWLFRYEEQFAASGRPINARLFMTGAEKEWPHFLDAIQRFRRQFESHPYDGLAYKFRLIDGERHAGTKAESYTRGMRFIFAPWAPE